MSTILILLVLALVALAVWIRVAPSDPQVWHVDPNAGVTGAGSFAAGFEDSAVYAVPPEALLERVREIAEATPGTVELAGSPEAGRLTFVTRSQVIGFPDYTTVAAEAHDGGSRLAIYARLRFGRSDFGVNAARVNAWLQALEPLKRP